MKIYNKETCARCGGEGHIQKVGYTSNTCLKCSGEGFSFKEIDPASLPEWPKKVVPLKRKSKGDKPAPTFTEFVQESKDKDK